MIKKIILVLIGTILFLTGCQSINGVDLNKMILNSTNVAASESKVTTALDFTYTRSKVQDPDLLKILDLFDGAKIEVQANVKDSSTASFSGNIILKIGKIPFKLYVDKKEIVILLDNASKPIRISVVEDGSSDTKLIQEIQQKLLAPVVKNLPNPKKITAGKSTQKVNGAQVAGYKVHAEIYAPELPELMIKFLDNLSKDQAAIKQMVSAINELDEVTGGGEPITEAEFKNGLKEFKASLVEMLPELKKDPLFSIKNYLKTDIFVDQKLFERKSTTEINLGSFPADSGLDISNVNLKISREVWNINGAVKVNKIPYKSYLNENATTEQIMATLDKKTSVLYSVIGLLSFEPSKSLDPSQVLIKNNKTAADTITVTGLAKGDVIRVYKAVQGGEMWAAAEAEGPTVTMSIKELGKIPGKVYISVIRSNKAESSRVAVAYTKEMVYPSQPLVVSQVEIKNNKNSADTIIVRDIAKGDVIKVYKAKTGSALWTKVTATGSNATISINQLGTEAGKVYISITRANMTESSRLEAAYAKEALDPSKTLTASQVTIKNNKTIADTLTVTGMAKGDVIKVYKSKTGSALWTSTTAKAQTASMAVQQLGLNAGKVYITITQPNKAESDRLEVAFLKE
ncbi:hypothetical protein [Bacillus sp. JJ1764]|uniref:hypothetical protein n=1 Tax=Bacillus sp. JJ1764 TaxID=3122964 RepID=UPI002FFFF34C